MMSFEPKKNVYCAMAISSMGEWWLNRNRLPRRRRKFTKRLTFFTAPRNDVLDGVVAEENLLND